MNPEKMYFELVMGLLDEIKLKSFALPKKRPPEPNGYYYEDKPHGIEFWVYPGEWWQIRRNIIYKLEEEEILKVLEEVRGDLGDGNRFIVELKSRFNDFYNQHKKGNVISKRLESEKFWVEANFQSGEIHLLIGDKEDDFGRHVHLIVGKSGELRIHEKDQSPAELLEKVVAITTKDGQKIEASLKFKK